MSNTKTNPLLPSMAAQQQLTAAAQQLQNYNPGPMVPWLDIYPHPGLVLGSEFRVEKIENGFVVHLRHSALTEEERHYAADEKGVGELVTATLVRWFLTEK